MIELSEKAIKALPIPATGNRITYFPEASRTGKTPVGFAVRVTAKGARSFVLSYRDATGEHRATIGKFPAMSLVRAVAEAAKMRLTVDAGGAVAVKRGSQSKALALAAVNPTPPKVVTVGDVIDDWIKRKGKDLRTLPHYEGAFRRYVRPALGALPVMELRKAPIRDMVDDIRAGAGPIMANKALGCLTSVLNWYAGQVDDFVPPVLKGLRGEAVARDRMLSAGEVAILWPLFEACGVYGVLCRVLLLTGQRRSDIAEAHWSEIGEGEARGRDAVACEGATLTIPAARYKTARAHTVPLSAPVRELLASLPPVPGTDRLFPTLNFSLYKTRLDALAPGIAHWTVHDLRRTATSLMIEARVRPDYVERVTHPEIAGIAGVYNRYAYLKEKTKALNALAAMVEQIINPAPAENVVALGG